MSAIKIHKKNAMFAALLSLTVLVLSPPLLAKEKVIVWSYYESPPFVVDMMEKKGLSFDFVEMLNLSKDNDQYEFVLKLVPRKRLNTYLSNDDRGIVLWVNPLFFDDKNKTRYKWTRRILEDEQSFISRASDPFIFKDAKSLTEPNFILGGIRGHIYTGIQNKIDEGLIKRHDVSRENQFIGMLLTKRVNTFLIPYTTMKYYEQSMGLTGKIFYSPKPLNSYTRSILVNHKSDVFKFLSKTVDNLANNKSWKVLLDRYNLEVASNKKTDF
ncbi:hypothetical protein [Endozoicomonas sp.]|uniref:hypothetical protein n=1 Tax=Endozoicomonas sp. TaxID=1892382 RepID=UPI002888D1EF|nr:hypothetical protein [Endozoicomonas sp.]